ncbi:MAG: hypothetical protein ACE148_09325 [Vicinamibacterales bacterium]
MPTSSCLGRVNDPRRIFDLAEGRSGVLADADIASVFGKTAVSVLAEVGKSSP